MSGRRSRDAKLGAALLCVLGLGSLAPAPALAQRGEWVPLFDGRTLAGWEGNPDFFRVEDGTIVGGTTAGRVPRNEFLCTNEEFGDFGIRAWFKLDRGANSGIQIHSQRIPGSHEVIGYQADLGDGYWGAIYDESRRNRVLVRPTAELIARVLDREGWNQYVVYTSGGRIRIFLNGQLTVDYTEPDAGVAQRGRICLQIHSGPPGTVRFRDIELKRLSPIPQSDVAPPRINAVTGRADQPTIRSLFRLIGAPGELAIPLLFY